MLLLAAAVGTLPHFRHFCGALKFGLKKTGLLAGRAGVCPKDSCRKTSLGPTCP